jgi:hypothetical protein
MHDGYGFEKYFGKLFIAGKAGIFFREELDSFQIIFP